MVITATFPDTLSIAMAGLDAHLLSHYYKGPVQPSRKPRRSAISGYRAEGVYDAANQAQRTDPVPDRATSKGTSRRCGTMPCPSDCATIPSTIPTGSPADSF